MDVFHLLIQMCLRVLLISKQIITLMDLPLILTKKDLLVEALQVEMAVVLLPDVLLLVLVLIQPDLQEFLPLLLESLDLSPPVANAYQQKGELSFMVNQ